MLPLIPDIYSDIEYHILCTYYSNPIKGFEDKRVELLKCSNGKILHYARSPMPIFNRSTVSPFGTVPLYGSGVLHPDSPGLNYVMTVGYLQILCNLLITAKENLVLRKLPMFAKLLSRLFETYRQVKAPANYRRPNHCEFIS